MKKIIYLFVLLIFVASCGKKTSDKNNTDDDTSMFPNADAVYLNLEKEYTLNADGSVVYQESKRLKLLTHTAFNRFYGETFIVFNPQYQELLINESKTVMADGKEVKTPENAYNDVLPDFASAFPAVNHLIERVITHTALEVNSIIELKYLLKTKSGFYPALMGNEIIPQSSPAKNIKIRVNVPPHTELNYKLLNDSTKVEVVENDSIKTYTWEFKNTQSFSHNVSIDEESLVRLIFNSKTFEEQQNTLLGNTENLMKVSENMSIALESSLKGSNNNFDRVEAIQGLVINNINLKRVPEKFTGYQVRTASEIWDSNVATPMEKAVLLSAMLTKAGFDNQIHLVLPAYITNQEGSLLNIEKPMIYIPQIDGATVYISPISNIGENLKYDMDGKNIVVWKKTGEIKSISNTSDNYITVNGYLKIPEETNLKGEISGTFTNINCPYFALVRDKTKANELLTGATESKIGSLSANEAVVHFVLNNREIIHENQGYYVFELPHSTKGIDAITPSFLLSHRDTPLKINNLISESYEFTIELADYLEPVVQEIELKEEYPFGAIELKISSKGKKVFVKRSITLTTKTIEIASYDQFRKMINYWKLSKYREIIFTKKVEN